MRALSVLLAFALSALPLPAAAQQRPKKVSPQAALFTTPLTLAEMAHKQAVVETSRGTFVIQLLPEVAPNHVGYFIKLARQGAYDGTTFHRAVPMGIIQGGDPLSKDPGKAALYGTGGLGVLKAELSDRSMSRGAVAAVLQPNRPDSGGSQFFVAVTDQPALTGHFTVYGTVVEGMRVVEQISQVPADDQGRLTERVEIAHVTIRDTPPLEPVPFSTESAGDLAAYRAVLVTSKGRITIQVRPDKAPETVRNFLRLAASGVYDGTTFHRVVPRFVIQTGMVSTRSQPLTDRQQSYVHNLQPEFNDLPHVEGTVSMARLDDPASASTSFFICTAPAPSLDGNYTAFGTVVEGLDVVHAIEQVPVNGDKPTERIDLLKVQVEKP